MPGARVVAAPRLRGPYVDSAPDLDIASQRLVHLQGPVYGLVAAGRVPLEVLVVGKVPVLENEPLEQVPVAEPDRGDVPPHVVGAVSEVLSGFPDAALRGLESELRVCAWRHVERVEFVVCVVECLVAAGVVGPDLVQMGLDVCEAVPVGQF